MHNRSWMKKSVPVNYYLFVKDEIVVNVVFAFSVCVRCFIIVHIITCDKKWQFINMIKPK